MAFDFPSNPAYGTAVTLPDGSFRVWDSQKWRAAPSGDTVMSDMFLPLTGGTVSGNILTHGNTEAYRGSFGTQDGNPVLFDGSRALSVAANPTFSGANWNQSFITNTYGQGSTTAGGGQPQWNLFTTIDKVNAPNVYSIANLASYYTLQGSNGARTNLQFSLTIDGNTNDPPGSGRFFQALSGGIVVDGTIGGTSTTVRGGQAFGSNITATATANGKYLNQICGVEIDVACQAGSQVWSKGGLAVTLQNGDAVESTNPSAAITIGLNSDSPASKGWGYGLVFNSGGSWWPINLTTGIMIYADPAHLTGSAAYTCASGIDFSAVTFGSYFLKSQGFTVDGVGNAVARSFATAGGIHFGANPVSAVNDFSKQIELYTGQAGITVTTDGNTNFVGYPSASHTFYENNALVAYINGNGITSAAGGLHFGAQAASAYNDFTHHIELYSGGGFTVSAAGFNYVSGSAHNFYDGAAQVVTINASGMFASSGLALGVGGATGPTWTTGSGVPSSVQPVGSLYSRVSTWAAGATLYVSKGAGAWTAVASV